MRKKRTFEYSETANFEQREELAMQLENDIQDLQIAKQSAEMEITKLKERVEDAVQDKRNELNAKLADVDRKNRQADELLAEYNRKKYDLQYEINAFEQHKKLELAKIDEQKKIVANGLQENIDRRAAAEDMVIAANKAEARALAVLNEAKRIRQEGEESLAISGQQLQEALAKNSDYETEMAAIRAKREEVEKEKLNNDNDRSSNVFHANALRLKEEELIALRREIDQKIATHEESLKAFELEKEDVLIQKKQNAEDLLRNKNAKMALDNRESKIVEREKLFKDQLK